MADTDFLLEDYVPVVKYHGLNTLTAISAGNAAKTSQNLIKGRLKLDVRPTGGTTEDYAEQIRANSAKTSGTFLGIDNESHLTADGTATIMSTRGVAVVDTGYTCTGGTVIGTYGQARADGTVAGSAFVSGLYGLIEASAAITASHVCSAWLDSHQANAVTGSHELLYMTNNGAAVLDQMIFTYGNANALINLDAAVAETPAFITGPGTAANGTPIKIKIIYKGTAYFLNAYPTDNA